MRSLGGFLAAIAGFFALAWLLLVAGPYLTFARESPEKDINTNELAPPGVAGVATQGQHVYAANGCVYCHSQSARDKNEGSDIDRGWATRRMVSRDHIDDAQVFLGVSRQGPDLANVGVRQKDAQWFYQYLYHPRSFDEATTMPAYRWLFKMQPIGSQPSGVALKLAGNAAPPAGYEVVPTAEAEALVGYLQSLKHDYPLPEAPEPKE